MHVASRTHIPRITKRANRVSPSVAGSGAIWAVFVVQPGVAGTPRAFNQAVLTRLASQISGAARKVTVGQSRKIRNVYP